MKHKKKRALRFHNSIPIRITEKNERKKATVTDFKVNFIFTHFCCCSFFGLGNLKRIKKIAHFVVLFVLIF